MLIPFGNNVFIKKERKLEVRERSNIPKAVRLAIWGTQLGRLPLSFK